MKASNVFRCVVFALGVASSGVAISAQIELVSLAPTVLRMTIKLSGQIVAADVAKFQSVAAVAIQQTKARRLPFPAQVFLDSPGGDVFAAMAIGRQIRANDFWTAVDSTCVSACTLIFAAGVTRSVDHGRGGSLTARIGIHRPFHTAMEALSPRDADLKQKQMDAAVRAYFKEMNIGESLAEAMLRIPPENVHYLTEGELKQYGLLEDDPGYAQRQATAQAKWYGLAMPEYYARLAEVNAKCRFKDDDGMRFFYCNEAIMYGVSVTDAERRYADVTRICGNTPVLTDAERTRRVDCKIAVMHGER